MKYILAFTAARTQLKYKYLLICLTAIVIFPLCARADDSVGKMTPKDINPTSLFNIKGSWVDENNNHYAFSELQGRQNVVTMAYTSCKKICSMTLHKLKEIQAVADQKNIALNVIVVTLDPATDNPETWRSYRKANNLTRSNWHFLTGSDADTKQLANYLGIEYWSDEGHIMHDFKVIKFSPEGNVEHFLDWDHRVAASLF